MRQPEEDIELTESDRAAIRKLTSKAGKARMAQMRSKDELADYQKKTAKSRWDRMTAEDRQEATLKMRTARKAKAKARKK